MGRNINKAIPKDEREWPVNERLEYPKWLGKDALDNPVIAQTPADEEVLKDKHRPGAKEQPPASDPVPLKGQAPASDSAPLTGGEVAAPQFGRKK